MRSDVNILVTAFEPFLNIGTNPTQLVTESINQDFEIPNIKFKVKDQQVRGEAYKTKGLETKTDRNEKKLDDKSLKFLSQVSEFKTVVLPVDFRACFKAFEAATKDFFPDLVICLGVACERNGLDLERLAINYMSCNHPDNSGHKPTSTKIDKTGPDAYFSNLQVDKILNQFGDNNLLSESKFLDVKSTADSLDIKVSNTAGTYVCNCLFYQVLQKAYEENFLAGFIHIPNKTDPQFIKKVKNSIYKVLEIIAQLEF